MISVTYSPCETTSGDWTQIFGILALVGYTDWWFQYFVQFIDSKKYSTRCTGPTRIVKNKNWKKPGTKTPSKLWYCRWPQTSITVTEKLLNPILNTSFLLDYKNSHLLNNVIDIVSENVSWSRKKINYFKDAAKNLNLEKKI